MASHYSLLLAMHEQAMVGMVASHIAMAFHKAYHHTQSLSTNHSTYICGVVIGNAGEDRHCPWLGGFACYSKPRAIIITGSRASDLISQRAGAIIVPG